MPTFYLRDERHTLASALRPELERAAGPDDFVACTLVHPLDGHLEVEAPSAAAVRTALLAVKARIAHARQELQEQQREEQQQQQGQRETA